MTDKHCCLIMFIAIVIFAGIGISCMFSFVNQPTKIITVSNKCPSLSGVDNFVTDESGETYYFRGNIFPYANLIIGERYAIKYMYPVLGIGHKRISGIWTMEDYNASCEALGAC